MLASGNVRRSARIVTLIVAGGLGAAGCNESTGPGAPAAVAPADSSRLTVAFVGNAATVTEGDTVEIPVRYSGGPTTRALPIEIVARNGTTSDADWSLDSESVLIPAASASGTAMVSLRGLEDDLWAEGNETLVLGLVAPPGSSAQVGSSINVSIADAGVSPCAGVRITAEPPELFNRWEGRGNLNVLESPETATIRMTIQSESGAPSVNLDWIGPYRDYYLSTWNPSFRARPVSPNNLLNAILWDWSFESEGSGVRHELRVEWLSEVELALRFRSDDGACRREPVAVCTGIGCALRRQPTGAGPHSTTRGDSSPRQ